MSEFREFWIEVKSFSSEILAAFREKPDKLTFRIAKEVIHVIEYSALAAHKEIIEELLAALEFECGNRCAIGLNECAAREVLTKAREKLAGMK